jgi:hypothetical protein
MQLASDSASSGTAIASPTRARCSFPLTMLCRDRCHYCTFAKPPARLDHPYLTPGGGRRDRGGRSRARLQGGAVHPRRPPRGPIRVARDWLEERGYRSTLEYVRAVAIRVIEETGLLPHLNPGVMSLGGDGAPQARQRLDGADARDAPPRGSRSEAARTSVPRTRIPAVRLRVIEDAGGSRSRSPRASSSASARPSRARRVAARDPGPPSPVPARPGGDRPELPGEARHRDARRAERRRGGVPRRVAPPASCSGRG